MHADAFTRTADAAPAELLAGAAPALQKRSRSRRAIFLTWLRKTHLYVGLWGAAFGLLFGVTGIVLNHRAIMKLPIEKTVQRSAQLSLPDQMFSSPEEMSRWLQKEIGFISTSPPQIKKQAAKTVVWAERDVLQPERWSINFASPERGVLAEYFVGNRFVKLDHVDATPIGTLTRLHMSVGVNAFWVLLSDTIAGSLILLSLTGLLLWTQLHTVRTMAVMTSVGALLAGMWFMWGI